MNKSCFANIKPGDLLKTNPIGDGRKRWIVHHREHIFWLLK